MKCANPIAIKTFRRKGKDIYTKPVYVNCGKCMACLSKKKNEWAIRLYGESMTHKESCFLTLTYDQKYLPTDNKVKLSHITNFIKKIRLHCLPKRIRFFQVGEYGDQRQRPHYHIIIYGYDFNDKQFLYTDDNGLKHFNSVQLSKLWKKGLSEVGEVNIASCLYISKYVVKSVVEYVDDETPIITTMSRRPGIGKLFFDKYRSDMLPHGYIVINGIKFSIPKYFFNCLKKVDMLQYTQIKSKRKQYAEEKAKDFTPAYREALKINSEKRAKTKRSFEDANI
ncbi:MAG: replication initiator protein [Arizlama microvirus]|nr:MAG: replication initiator protein [Arizlama microvirus]